MGVGRSLCWRDAGTRGAGQPHTKPFLGLRHPARTSPRPAHAGRGGVFREEFLHDLCSYFIYNPNSKTERINYMVDQFMQDRERPSHTPAHVSKVEELACPPQLAGPAH